jgi:hypothetical protein
MASSRFYPGHNSRSGKDSPFWKGDRKKRESRRDRREYHTAKKLAYRLRTLAHYGGKCACCGEEAFEFLVIDHIGGGGNEHRRQIGRSNIVPWLMKNGFPEGFRVLCHNCNFAIGAYGQCPHQS